MTWIFESASQVLLWIADEAALARFAEEREALSPTSSGSAPSVWDDTLFFLSSIHRHEHLSHISEWELGGFCTKLKLLVSFPFWTRVWIVQEIVVAQRVIVLYGPEQDSWHNLQKAALILSRHAESCCADHFGSLPEQSRKTLLRFVHIIERISKYQDLYLKDNSLLLYLWQNTDREASDPRDLVYALLGLAEYFEDEPLIGADYRISVVEMNRYTAIRIIQSLDNLSALYGVNRAASDRSGAPRHIMAKLQSSWIPDFCARLSPDEIHRISHSHLFRACGDVTANFRYANKTVLPLSGIKFDVLSSTADCDPLASNLAEAIKPFIALLTSPNNTRTKPRASPSPDGRSPRPPPVDWKISLARTLTHDLLPQISSTAALVNSKFRKNLRKGYAEDRVTFAPSIIWQRWNDFEATATQHPDPSLSVLDSWRRWLDQNTAAPAELSLESLSLSAAVAGTTTSALLGIDSANMALVRRSVEACTPNRRFFVTRRGYCGLGPVDAQPGDQIFVLAGAGLPFLLREAGERRVNGLGKIKAHSLVGECYVHGIMDGEGFDKARAKKVFLV
jgi:hypothetical protein